MIPSIPRFRIPDRSVNISPRVAYTRGVATRKVAAINPTRKVIDRVLSTPSLRWSTTSPTQGDAIALQQQHPQCNQEQSRLQDIAQVDRDAQGAAHSLRAGVDQPDKHRRQGYANRIQSPQRGNDNACIAITRGNRVDKMKVNPRNFACTRQSVDPAAGQGNHDHGTLNVYSGKPGRFNIESNRLHLQAERSAAQDKPHAKDDQ